MLDLCRLAWCSPIDRHLSRRPDQAGDVKVEEPVDKLLAGHGSARGDVREGFEPVRDLFQAFLGEDPEHSAGLCAYWRGEKVLDLLGGPGAAAEAVSPVFSASKGVSALTLSLLVQEGDLDLDRFVVDYWPQFAAGGKDRVTVRELLTHQVGLLGAEGGLTVRDLCLDRVQRKVERSGRQIELTTKEFALLEYLMRNAGRRLTRAMIIEHVWNLTFDSTTNVVDVYINYLRRKVDDGFSPALIHTVRGVGYEMSPEGASA